MAVKTAYIVISIIIIKTLFFCDNTLAKPISLKPTQKDFHAKQYEMQQQKYISNAKFNSKLEKRQVVQPKWLTQNGFAVSVDPTVRVNEQNLREAAEIRKEIQAAVQEGRFAVTALKASGTPISPDIAKVSIPQTRWPQWNFQSTEQARNWNMSTWQEVQAQVQQYMEALQKRWLELLAKSNTPTK